MLFLQMRVYSLIFCYMTLRRGYVTNIIAKKRATVVCIRLIRWRIFLSYIHHFSLITGKLHIRFCFTIDKQLIVRLRNHSPAPSSPCTSFRIWISLIGLGIFVPTIFSGDFKSQKRNTRWTLQLFEHFLWRLCAPDPLLTNVVPSIQMYFSDRV